MHELEETITRQRASEPFSGVVSLRQGDTILFERAYGAALRSEAIPNRIDTRFQVASGCKIFTSVAICQLIEHGVLSPDTLLANCVDVSFAHFDPHITIHQLLTHTSGIPDYFDEAVMDDYEALWLQQPMYMMRRPADFLPLFQDKPMQRSAWGSLCLQQCRLCGLGPDSRAATGMRFTDYVAEHIFRAVWHGTIRATSPRISCRRARRSAYIENADGTWRSNIYAVPIVGGPDGGAYTTAADMARFWQALFAAHIVGRRKHHPAVNTPGRDPVPASIRPLRLWRLD